MLLELLALGAAAYWLSNSKSGSKSKENSPNTSTNISTNISTSTSTSANTNTNMRATKRTVDCTSKSVDKSTNSNARTNFSDSSNSSSTSRSFKSNILEPEMSFDVYEPRWGLNYRLTCKKIYKGHGLISNESLYGHGLMRYYNKNDAISLNFNAELLSPAQQIFESAARLYSDIPSFEAALSSPYPVWQVYFSDKSDLSEATINELEKCSFEVMFQDPYSNTSFVKVDRDHIILWQLFMEDIHIKIAQYLHSVYPNPENPDFKPEAW